jgi:CHAT domain-containing protein/tetratricopeptide (TPR) repeat protein
MNDLIGAFFDHLRLRHLERCRATLDELAARTRGEPDQAAWVSYLSGILAFELRQDWAEAERSFSAVLEAETPAPPDLKLRALYALGRALDAQGRWDEALATFERCRAAAGEEGRRLDQAKAWKHAAITICRGYTHGDYGPRELDRAIAHCEQALAALTADDLEPTDADELAWLVGSVWNTMGLLYRNLGRWEDAIDCYRRDLAICEDLDDRHGAGLSHGNLGEIYHLRGAGSWPQALAAYQRALAIVREYEDRVQEVEVLANMGFLHQEMGEAERALDFYEQAITGIETLRAGISEEGARAGFFATVVDTYARAVLLAVECDDLARAFAWAERARSRAFLDALAAGTADLAPDANAPTVTLPEVQAALPPDTLLIAYFGTGLVEPGARGGRSAALARRHRFPPSRCLILAVTSEEIQAHNTGLSPNDLLPRRLDSVIERHFLDPRMRAQLYQRLISPIERLLRGRQRVYLVPHGPLHYVPFQALVAADGEPLLREDGPDLVYAPSATVLLREPFQAREPADKPCLAVGYNGGPDAGAPRLRYAEDEAHSVARQCGGRALVGPEPKREGLYREAGDYRRLHFSCHGEFDPSSPLASCLHLGSGERLSALDVLQHMRLRCDLVTLSACESGLSRVRRGDELEGLIRAFLHAGAGALVSTLWRVDERTTRILMERFYQNILAGLDFARALQSAQLYLRALTLGDAKRALAAGDSANQEAERIESDPLWQGDEDERPFEAPTYWAPFILVGSRPLV